MLEFIHTLLDFMQALFDHLTHPLFVLHTIQCQQPGNFIELQACLFGAFCNSLLFTAWPSTTQRQASPLRCPKS